VQNQIYTVFSWLQKAEARIAPTVKRKKKHRQTLEVNVGSNESATHQGLKSPAANEGQALFKAAAPSVLKTKDKEWHRLVGADEKKMENGRQINKKL